MKNIIYTILTGIIILLAKLREKTLGEKPRFRWDRTIPVPYEDQGSSLYIKCCDCGLSHFILYSRSATPVRPLKYDYRLRFGSKAWTEPDLELGQDAHEAALKRGLCGKGIIKENK